jgi:hypothetical protein
VRVGVAATGGGDRGSAVTSRDLAEARLQFKRRFIGLARTGGSRTRAAREPGLSRQGLLGAAQDDGAITREKREARSRM